MRRPIITASLTVATMLLAAIDRVKPLVLFDLDPYESRRKAMPGSRLLKTLAFFQLLKDPSQRGLVRAVEESQDAQKALGGTIARNTLSNALAGRDPAQMSEAWMRILHHYSPSIARMGKKFARIAAVDASLIKLSLQAYDWATYRKKTGAARITCVLNWMQAVPQQFVFNASGKVHDLQATLALRWCVGWTYLFDRGYFSFDLLTAILNAGAHFVIRYKREVTIRIVNRVPIPAGKMPAGIRKITSDWIVQLPGWDGEVLLRMVSYKLTDGKLIRVLTSRHDLSALSIAQLYKERWSIEKWWRWLKRIYKVKEPLGYNENALQLQIIAAFVTDLLLRAFKHCSGFKGTLYGFVATCRDLALVPLDRLSGNLRQALSTAATLLELQQAVTDCPT